jgi:AcrR family transcriptional regulator
MSGGAYPKTVSQAVPDLPRARQARSRVTRELIFQAAASLLEEGGAEALTVAAVAARAGVSVGSVYRRFGDKDRLMASLQADFTRNFRAEIIRRFTSSTRARDDPAAVITAAVRGVAETFQSHQRLMRVFMVLGATDEAVLRQGSEASMDGGQAFRRFLDPVVPAVRHPDAEAALDFAFRFVHAMCAYRVVNGEHFESARPLPWRQLIEELAATVRLYLLGELPAGAAW